MKLPDFEGWAIFASVVEAQSFSGAAAHLGVSKATISKAISRLEARLGTSLFHRTSRKLTLTESGRVLAERARRILSEGAAAEEAALAAAQAPAGLIRMTAPLTFGLHHVAPALADFLIEYPGISVELSLSDARVDIVAQGYDIALRIANLPDSSLRARRIASVTGNVVGAPSYFARAGRPRHPAELAHHNCLLYTNSRTPEIWRFSGPGGEEASVQVSGPLSTDNGDAMLPALRVGLGIAWLPDFIVERDIADGILETVLDEWNVMEAGLHLVTPPGALRPQRVEALLDFLEDRLRTQCRGR